MERAIQVLQRLKGPVVPLNICFTGDNEIDYPAMRRYVNWLCEQQVPVLLLTYGSSEFSAHSDEEIWRLSAELAEAIGGRSLSSPRPGCGTRKCAGDSCDTLIRPGSTPSRCKSIRLTSTRRTLTLSAR